MYVEFIGSSGAGKTTIAREVIKSLIKENYIVDTYIQRIIPSNRSSNFLGQLSRIQKYIIYIWTSIKNFCGIIKILKFYLSLHPFSLKLRDRKDLTSFIKMFVSQRALGENKQADIFLLDRGYVNMLSTVTLYKKFDNKKIQKVLEYLYKDTVLAFVVISINPKMGLKRIQRRPPKGDYREKLPYKNALQDYIQLNRRIKQISSIIFRDKAIKKLYIQGDENVNKNKERILNFIDSIVR